MLPQLAAIPLQTTGSSNDSGQNLNRLLPVGQNVSATVVAVSRDQIQPEIFRLKLEVNNRLIQMGVFQALPVGQKINVNRQSDGQIQITPQPQQSAAKSEGNIQPSPQNPIAGRNEQAPNNQQQANLTKLSLPNSESAAKIPADTRIIAAVISSRAVYANQTTSPPGAQNQPSTPISPQTINTTQTGAGQSTSSPQSTQAPNSAIVSAQATPPNASGTPAQSAGATTTISQPTPQTPLPTANQGQAQAIHTQSPNQAVTPQAGPISSPPLTNTPTESKGLASGSGQPPQTSNNTGPRSNTLSTTPNQPAPQSAGTTTAPVSPRPSGPPIHHVVTLALPDGSKLETVAAKPLPQGAQIQLEKSSGQELQILRMREPPLTQASALEKPAIQEVLRNSLPNQIPTGNAFSQLAATVSNETAQAGQISGVVRSMLQLFGVRPGSSEATSQIRNNVELGGYGTERTLSKGFVPQPQEMRSQLNQLQQLAEKLPEGQRDRLEQLLNGIQSRITSQQLTSLQQWRELPDGGFERVLQLDLPIKQGENWENLELRLSREGGSNAAGEMVSVWRVRLHFDLEELGGVDAEIRLTDGHEISTLFWCEQPETAERLRQRSEEFSERLRECGFNNTEVNWHEGSAPEQKQVLHKQLVDLHT
ncbi:flagellar hook-length control protein FliK [Neptuniibacter caesariensis]|uniref:Flagellar hook-length control protein-like C-terminal domain-containing protein n=1 Tax=Neptuniibacter caesariensis TaxID=207954 RepID=A0A7U8GRP0_NEPCE|nr:flagellar hook-length control protein FliK [Neptuniibacter caesariensis]EAR60551.1 hypothetical protein MED92_16845 [Oceanospirillum sp. MED92] [Neptuniibacter caesariensis]